jgi:aminoglycoside phosphotransferase (APT) family kinase protein
MRSDRQEPFTHDYVKKVLAVLEDVPDEPPREIELNTEHSNDLAEVWFRDGRMLMIKRARYLEMAPRFETSRVASRLLNEQAGIVAPDPLELSEDELGEPVLAYWKISNPTLAELWPEIGGAGRTAALQSWGALMRRIHQVQLPGHGPLLEAREAPRPLEDFLRSDVEERLRPAAEGVWPAGVRALDRLAESVPTIKARSEANGAVLLHNDLFTANVLCEREEDRIDCVGVLDLEDAFAGPPEADLAKTEILHGPLFNRPWEGFWFERILEGYGDDPDPRLIAFFRAYHLLNMGYHAAATGLEAHAEEVAHAAAREIKAMESGRRHREVVR